MRVNIASIPQLALCLTATLSALVLYACVSLPSENGGLELCEHRGWPGPEDDWSEYEVLSSPFVEAVGVKYAPVEPPVVQMAVEVEANEVLVNGVRYTADWINKYTRLEQRPTEPWPWPRVVDGLPCHVRMLTDSPPGFVTVIGYPDVDKDIGEPDIDTGVRYECGSVGDRLCVHIGDDGFVEIYPIPQPLLDMPYIIVFAIWSISPWEQVDGSANTSASWLFRFPKR